MLARTPTLSRDVCRLLQRGDKKRSNIVKENSLQPDANILTLALFSCQKFCRIFQDSLLHRIFGRMHEALNIDKK
jgi:hypothetical protein